MAGWTDYWPDWSSAKALKLAPINQILKALSYALIERLNIQRQTALPQTNYLFSALNRYKTDIPLNFSPARDLHLRISRSVFGYYGTGSDPHPYYYGRVVNPATGSVNFNGLESIPYVSIDSAPEILGEELLPFPNKTDEFIYWAYQQYRILNLAKWFSSPNPNIQYFNAQAKYFNSPLDATYAERLAALNAATWTNTTPPPTGIVSYMYRYDNLIIRGFPAVNNLWFDIDTDLEFSIDLYVKPRKLNSYFFPAIDDAIENRLLKIGYIPTTQKKPFGEYYLDTTTIIEPTPPPGLDYGFQLSNGYPGESGGAAIFKFDGENGLHFRGDDW